MNEQRIRITRLLHDHFGFQSFRPGQEETINSVVKNENTLAILPTGAGKSLLYQLPAYLFSGTVIIISPLISLMQDQVDRLHQQGEKAVIMLNGQLVGKERSRVLNRLNDFRFIFTSPEMLANKRVQTALQRIKISFLVIDEAHCISQWGPDFRPEYLLLKQIRQQLGMPKVLMLTATATPQVQTDILTKMGIAQAKVQVVSESVDRPNIYLEVEKFLNQVDKQDRLLELVKKYQGPGVIYFASRKLATQMAEWLNNNAGVNVVAYHAGVSAVERFKIQKQFMNGTAQVICATSAFGMGIDKNDIRFIIHYHLPSNLENYLQEIGRAGRDGEQSIAILLYANGDENIQRQLTSIDLPSIELLEQINQGKLHPSVLGEQADLFSFYLQHHYSPREIISSFDQRQRQLAIELRKMIGYIDTTSCRRKYILEYFGEKLIKRPSHCCDLDRQDNAEIPIKILANTINSSENGGYWQSRLDKLLNISER